ncbi:MAG: AzlC family ABC transporter permease [Proteobacteria bacterium]|nr:AzlC family ABC transporter permease [Pseudomonadota bacterium]
MSNALPVTFTRAGFLRGVRASPPLLIGGLPFGLVAGLTAQAHGLSFLESTLMSATVFAGSAQLIALGVWAAPVSVSTVSLASLTMNLRFLLMGPLLAPWMDHLRGWRRWLSLFFMIDHNWALALKEIEKGERDAAFLIGSGVPIWIVWVVSSIVGHLSGSLIHTGPGHPLFFAALSTFIALLVPMWRGKSDLLPWLVAGSVALVVSQALPHTAWHIVIGALAGGITGLLQQRWRPS